MPDPIILNPASKSASEIAAERSARVIEDVYANAIKKATKLVEEQKLSFEDVQRVIEKYPGNLEKANEELRNMITSATELNLAWSTGKDILKDFAQHMGVNKELSIGLTLATGQWAKALSEAAIYGAQLVTDWVEHTAKVNRQLYDTNAALGKLGESSREFESTIKDVSSRFNELPDDIRKTVQGMATIGMSSSEIKEHIDDIYVLSKQWADITPEKQIHTMSLYMKEFGMTGDKAWATMFSLYNTAEEVKKSVTNLDIQKFVAQTNEVAVSMRRYGLEVSDAIALTSTLAKLGVEQARLGEITKTVAGVGLESPATVAYMTSRQLLPAMREERTGLVKKLEAGEGTPTEQADMAQRIAEIDQRMNIMNRSTAGLLGGIFTAKPEERVGAQMGMLEEMVKVGTGGRGLQQASREELIGALSQLKLPGIGQMSPEAVREFATALDKGGLTPENLKKALGEAVKKQEGAADLAAKQAENAEKTADATTTMQKDVELIRARLGLGARELTSGSGSGQAASPEAAAEWERRSERGEFTKSVMLKSKSFPEITSGLAEYEKSLQEGGYTKEEQAKYAEAAKEAANQIAERFKGVLSKQELTVGFDSSGHNLLIMDKTTGDILATQAMKAMTHAK